MELKGKVINFLGDSITQGHGVMEEKNIYHQRIAKTYKLKRANNYGISGTRFAKQQVPTVDNPSFDQWFASRVEDLDPAADAVVVFGGTNDWGHGDAPIGTFSDRTEDSFYGACHVLYSKLIARFPGKPIVVVTPLHRVGERDKHKREDREMMLSDYVDIIKEVARYYSLPVCDMFSISGLQPEIPEILEMYIPDGLHPNDAGHKVLADRIGSFLKAL